MHEQWPFINALSSAISDYNFTIVTGTSYALIFSVSYHDGVSIIGDTSARPWRKFEWRFSSSFPKHFSRMSMVKMPRAHAIATEAAGIKFTATRTDLRNAYLARKLARRLRVGRSFYDWIRVGTAIPELVEQVDKFRSLSEPPCFHRHHSLYLYLFVVDKRILEYRVGEKEAPRPPSRVAAKFGPADVTWTGLKPVREKSSWIIRVRLHTSSYEEERRMTGS